MPVFCGLRLATAAVCNPAEFYGPYGMQLSGMSQISGSPQPVAVVGRLVFETGGKVSGTSSLNFNGLFLGNPVTGTYEFHDDCSLTMNLQDDSGAFQHFEGNGTAGTAEIRLRQTDPGSGSQGTLKRVSHECGNATLRGDWLVAADSVTTPLAVDPVPRRFSGRGGVSMDGASGLTMGQGSDAVHGSYQVDSDCFVEMTMGDVHLRGVLVNGGREVLAIQTDPAQMATVRFTAKAAQ
jgi:hypothetical protein